MGSLPRSITSSPSSLFLMQLDSSFPIVRHCKTWTSVLMPPESRIGWRDEDVGAILEQTLNQGTGVVKVHRYLHVSRVTPMVTPRVPGLARLHADTKLEGQWVPLFGFIRILISNWLYLTSNWHYFVFVEWINSPRIRSFVEKRFLFSKKKSSKFGGFPCSRAPLFCTVDGTPQAIDCLPHFQAIACAPHLLIVNCDRWSSVGPRLRGLVLNTCGESGSTAFSVAARRTSSCRTMHIYRYIYVSTYVYIYIYIHL